METEMDRLIPTQVPHPSAHGDNFVADTARRRSRAVRRALLRTRTWLLDQQQEGGYWEAELEGDTILESEYVLLLAFFGKQDSLVARKAARTIEREQLPTGGWAIYPQGPLDISASVKAYFALKLTGSDPSSPAMTLARQAILAAGGVDAVNSFTRFYLALLGQISYEQCPAVPPEALLLPRWAPINIYKVSSWSRTILVPLSIISAYAPVRNLPAQLGIGELFLKHPRDWPPLRSPGVKGGKGLLSWDRFFRGLDRLFKFCQRHRLTPLRKRGIRAARAWMLERFQESEGLGAIFPPMIWSLIALDCLGYSSESPEMRYCWEHLDELIHEDFETVSLQPCKSPVWDTAITLRALAASGVRHEHPAAGRALRWLLDKEVRRRGDWTTNVKAEPGGWAFEHANAFYPDVDDSAMVVMAINEQLSSLAERGSVLPPGLMLTGEDALRSLSLFSNDAGELTTQCREAARRAVAWVLALQNQDGGWGAFDKDNDSEFLCYVPFADHNAMIDPSTPDLTARVLEMLGQQGLGPGHPAIDRALDYLRRTQEADGSWFGRWGVNYIYGTWQVLLGLRSIGLPSSDPLMARGANWLLSHQQPCGGWGESPATYAEPHLRGQGAPTASQTAWAIWGLVAAGEGAQPAVARGVEYLLAQQLADGTWDEPEYTGTGFPQVFYLRYYYYPIYFPLLALAAYAETQFGVPEEESLDLSESALCP